MTVFEEYSDSDDGELWEEPASLEFALEAVLKQWASDVSTGRREAAKKREAAVEQEKRGAQKHTQQDLGDDEAELNPLDGQTRKRHRGSD